MKKGDSVWITSDIDGRRYRGTVIDSCDSVRIEADDGENYVLGKGYYSQENPEDSRENLVTDVSTLKQKRNYLISDDKTIYEYQGIYPETGHYHFRYTNDRGVTKGFTFPVRFMIALCEGNQVKRTKKSPDFPTYRVWIWQYAQGYQEKMIPARNPEHARRIAQERYGRDRVAEKTNLVT